MRIVLLTVLAAAWLPVFAAAEQAHHQTGGATIRGGQVHGEPWAEKGAWRLRLMPTYLRSAGRYDGSGGHASLPENGTFNGTSLAVFVERSVSERWSLSALGSVQEAHLKSDLGHSRFTSLGDTFLWARRSLASFSGIEPSVLAGLKAPGTYRSADGVGDGQVDAEAQGVLAKPLPWGFIAGNAGLRYRGGGISDEAVYGVQLGVRPAKGWLVSPALSGAYGLGAGARKDFVAGSFSVARALKGPWGVLASYSRVLAGRNTASADIWSAGVSFR